MPLWPEGKQPIGVSIGQLLEDVLTLTDIEALAFKINDEGFGQLVQSNLRIFPALSCDDHLCWFPRRTEPVSLAP